MTQTEAFNAIVSRYLNEYNGQFPIAIDNKKFSIPNPPVKWVRLHVKFNDGKQSSLGKAGNRKYVKYGLIFMQVFTPINTGTDENNTLVDASVNVFDGVRLDDLWMYNGRSVTVGSDGEFFQQNGVVEFEYELIR
jgi:hypothetical protein